MKYCFGVISKNQVDTVLEYAVKYEKEITFIPSRRQVEFDGGYVNNWTTKEFSEYVKNSRAKVIIQRDHGGPGQGLYDDDGFRSLEEDCKYFDQIHIDPWKKYPLLADGIQWTIDLINFCHKNNENICFEIGTEEAIRPYSCQELEEIIVALKTNLSEQAFEKIKYCVVQCGNSLIDSKNNNKYDETKLTSMLKVVKQYHLTSKEHNGDYNSIQVVNQKEKMGLEYINIAPEFGKIESAVILNQIKENATHHQQVYDLCIQSGKWKKWVSADFDVVKNKDEIILITCHYIYSHPEFLKIKNTYSCIDEAIKRQITKKLIYWDNYYTEREKCCICDCASATLETLLPEDIETPLTLSLFNAKHNVPQIPYNVAACSNCESTQIKYLGNIAMVYENNHIDAYGTTKGAKHTQFKNFVLENDRIQSICEIGAATGELAHQMIKEPNIHDYTIVETDYRGETNDKLKIVDCFFEDADPCKIKGDCLIMSDLFEHFYEPLAALQKIKECNYEYVILNHPDFDFAVKNDHCIVLNIEHTFLIEHQLLFQLFHNYGYALNRRVNFKDFSLFLEFKKQSLSSSVPLSIKNHGTRHDTLQYICHIQTISQNINRQMIQNQKQNQHKKYYIWPCSVHTFTLFLFGLDYTKFAGILDNSPNKIGKYIDGYDLLCESFDALLKINDKNSTIIISGANEYIKELNLETECEIKFLEDF